MEISRIVVWVIAILWAGMTALYIWLGVLAVAHRVLFGIWPQPRKPTERQKSTVRQAIIDADSTRHLRRRARESNGSPDALPSQRNRAMASLRFALSQLRCVSLWFVARWWIEPKFFESLRQYR